MVVNGVKLPAVALCDTGAKTRLLASKTFARQAVKQLGAKITRLKKPTQLTDFRGQPNGSITHLLEASFEVQGRLFAKEQFRVTETTDDIFIGQDWLAEKNVLLMPACREIIWPDDPEALAKAVEAMHKRYSRTELPSQLLTESDSSLHQPPIKGLGTKLTAPGKERKKP